MQSQQERFFKISALTAISMTLGATFFHSNAGHATSTLAQDTLGELDAMRSVFRAEYAPIGWKKKFANYSLDDEYTKAVQAVNSNPNLSLSDTRTIFKNFIYAMKDYHTSISFVATESASLPFSVRSTDTKVFLAYIDRSQLTAAAFPFQVGDELVTFGDKPALQAIAEVQAEVPANVPETDKMLAELRLTKRAASRGYIVPQGTITIGVRPQGKTAVQNLQLIWNYTPEQIATRSDLSDSTDLLSSFKFKNTFSRSPLQTKNNSTVAATRTNIFHPIMSADFKDFASKQADTLNPFGLGTKESFIPALGTKIWEAPADGNYAAYIFKTSDRKLIGYVRIPQYETEDYIKAIAEFSEIIARFEATTDALVIDQVNNPGGSVFYLYSLASMLTDQPLITPKHRMAINQSDVESALEQIELMKAVKTDADAQIALPPSELDGYPSSYEMTQFNLSYARFIVSEWNAGRRLTRPYFIGGVDHINPASTHYTKPILLITNALDFSGGDFFPAILQDNHRATLFGARTAGAGGYVNDIQVPNNVGVNSFRCTESIAERASLNPLENLGITPDIAYSLSEKDFTDQFSEYKTAILKAVDSIVK